jgi:hypothetical protein
VGFCHLHAGRRGAFGRARGLPAEAATPVGATGLVVYLPILLVLPNAVYGLWLLRDIARTHANPDD